MARNKFKSALNHIKSTKIDEKIQRLNESPTNNTSSVYDLSPSGQRYGRYDRNPEQVFYANADGSWPSGVPGTPGERTYTRPIGYWEEGPGATPSVQHDVINKLDFSYNTQIDNPRQTTSLIDEDTGRVFTDLPPNSRSFILGPLVDMYFHNHRTDNLTYVGYIQKDTREFVLLGYVRGTWGNDNNGDPIRADGYESGFNSRVWDGQESTFTASNPNFTFEMLQWHHERLKEGKYVKNVAYFNSGGIPVQSGRGGEGQPSGTNQGNVSGTPIGGDAGDNGDANLTHGSGTSNGEPTIGSKQDPPIPGNNDDADVHTAMDNLGGWLAAAAALGFVFKSIEAFVNWFRQQSPEMQKKLRDLVQDNEIAQGYAPGGPNPYGTPGADDPFDNDYYKGPPPDLDDDSDFPDLFPELDLAKGKRRRRGPQVAHHELKGKVLTESRKRILREIKQPVAEVAELKPEKLKKYKPNFKGRFTPQNTPDVTASKESDKIVKAKNAAGQTWRTSDKYWGGYESQERANIIYDHVGHGQLYWDEIVSHNQGKKGVRDREIQEQLNKHYAYLAEKKMMKELNLDEQETMNAIDDPLFKRVKNKLLPKIHYPSKPSQMGYPDAPPPVLDPLTGMHPEYGKKYKHDKLDPISADAMPLTGDPEIDMTVAAQKTPLKSVKKVYKKGKPNS